MNTKVACFLPASILSVLACIQIYNSQFQGLTPWKGAGFGMFSTIQRIEARFLKAYLIDSDHREYPVSVPNSFWAENRSVCAWPNHEKMENLALQLVSPNLKWHRTQEPISPTGPMEVHRHRESNPPTKIRPLSKVERTHSNAEPIDPVSIRLELWRYTIDREANQMVASEWMETTQSRPNP